MTREYYTPKDLDTWSKRDRDDYNYLISCLPGTTPIPEETLEKMSIRVLQAAEQLYMQAQFDIAEELEMDELPDINPSVMITQRLCDPGCAALIDDQCIAQLRITDLVTMDGLVQTIDICKLPDGLKVVGY